MIKLICLIVVFIAITGLTYTPVVEKIGFKIPDPIALFAALLALHTIFREYMSRNKETEIAIHVTPLVSYCKDLGEILNELDIVSKTTIHQEIPKIDESLRNLQERTTTVIGKISNHLQSTDSHCKLKFKTPFEEKMEQDIYQKFSHLLQHNKKDLQSQEIFSNTINSLKISFVDIKELLGRYIKKISDKL